MILGHGVVRKTRPAKFTPRVLRGLLRCLRYEARSWSQRKMLGITWRPSSVADRALPHKSTVTEKIKRDSM